jgi:hypothetical protein
MPLSPWQQENSLSEIIRTLYRLARRLDQGRESIAEEMPHEPGMKQREQRRRAIRIQMEALSNELDGFRQDITSPQMLAHVKRAGREPFAACGRSPHGTET